MSDKKRFKPLPSDHPALANVRAMGTQQHVAYVEAMIQKDPTVSKWLKEQVEVTKGRDIVDAIKDTEVLLDILKQRFEGITSPSNWEN